MAKADNKGFLTKKKRIKMSRSPSVYDLAHVLKNLEINDGFDNQVSVSKCDRIIIT